VSLTIEFVDSAAGSRKTLTAVAQAVAAVRNGRKTIFAMPTLELIAEMADFARRDPTAQVHVITHRTEARRSIDQAICHHIERTFGGHLLFITHEALVRVLDWPQQANEYHLIIDEVLDVVLTRAPFLLRYSHFVLTQFLETAAMQATLAERSGGRRRRAGDAGRPTWVLRDLDHLAVYERIVDPTSHAAPAEVDMATQRLEQLRARQAAAADEDLMAVYEQWLQRALDNRGRNTLAEMERIGRELLRLRDNQDAGNRVQTSAAPYYRILPNRDDTNSNAFWQTELRARGTEVDDVYRYLAPIPRWLLEGAPLFTDIARWNRMVNLSQRGQRGEQRGLITISGFRRPDLLTAFEHVTMMSALFRHTMLYAVWARLGVDFIPSTEIRMAVSTSPLFGRKLKIYWLIAHGWSKKTRDRIGGIEQILRLIDRANVIDPAQKVCVVVNKDDGSEQHPAVVTDIFANGIVMPHNSRGQNRFRGYNQLVYCASLNSYTSDIRWLEQVLGIDARHQRIARLGQEVYQSAMRLSLREPSATADVTLVVIDKDVAEWLVQWFEPQDQVEIAEIDASGVIRPHGRPGRRAIGDRPMTAAERQRRRRLRQRSELPGSPPPDGNGPAQ
jgi:hypothetical protein